jgi:hypothetical protein
VWEVQTMSACPAPPPTLTTSIKKLCNQYAATHVPVPECVKTCHSVCKGPPGGPSGNTASSCSNVCEDDCTARDAATAENAARDAAAAGGNTCVTSCGIGHLNMTPVEWAALTQCYNNCRPSNSNVSCNGEGIFNYCVQTITSGSCNSDKWHADCVTASTRVTLKDGTQVPITSLKSGDVVKGDNSLNTVTRVRPEKKRDLYSINGVLTLTIDHPVATTEGYKIVNEAGVPNCKARYGLDKVGILKVGDKIIADKGEIIVKKVTSVPPENVLYNLELDGNKTFYANGILVRGI